MGRKGGQEKGQEPGGKERQGSHWKAKERMPMEGEGKDANGKRRAGSQREQKERKGGKWKEMRPYRGREGNTVSGKERNKEIEKKIVRKG